MSTKYHMLLKVWGMPVLIAAFTIAGLLLAIMGTGIWHYLSWAALCIPAYLMIKHGIQYFK